MLTDFWKLSLLGVPWAASSGLPLSVFLVSDALSSLLLKCYYPQSHSLGPHPFLLCMLSVGHPDSFLQPLPLGNLLLGLYVPLKLPLSKLCSLSKLLSAPMPFWDYLISNQPCPLSLWFFCCSTLTLAFPSGKKIPAHRLKPLWIFTQLPFPSAGINCCLHW